MLDFNKELPPSAVEEKKLLLQITRDHLIAGLNEEVAGIVHLHVLLHPVGKVSEENLECKTVQLAYGSNCDTVLIFLALNTTTIDLWGSRFYFKVF